MAIYQDIANDIREKIISGVYENGERLPQQKTLAQQYQTSRMTIQKAMELLKYEGVIQSIPGSGTYVKPTHASLSRLDSRADNYTGTTKQFEGAGAVTSKILTFTVRFPKEIEHESLMINPSSPVYEIHRLRLLDGEPINLEYTIMPVEVIKGITEEVLNKSIYAHIEGTLGLSIGVANRRIHADKPTEDDQLYLECQECDPILEVSQVVFLDNGTPFEYSHSRHRYDKGDILFTNWNAKKQ